MSAALEFSESAARQLDDRIRTVVAEIRGAWDDLVELLEEASAGNLHISLGFPSWTAYVADVFGDNPVKLERPDRRQAVEYLAGQGMSTRAIGAVLGINGSTVGRDLAINGREPDADQSDREVVGLDGATYKRPRNVRSDVNLRSKQPKRPTVFRQADEINGQLSEVVAAVQELCEDKRYSNHRETLATAFRPAFERMRRLEAYLLGERATP